MSLSSFTTSSRDGDTRAKGALERLLKKKSWPTAVATAQQVHGDRIQIVPALQKPVQYKGTDGLITDQPNQPLAIFTADCASIFLTDKRERVIGVLHAGWRGTRAGILRKAVRLIRRRWRIPVKRLKVWLGPSIGPCCFEVQWDVARYFPKTRKRLVRRSISGGGWTVDIAGELHAQARRLGVHVVPTKLSCTMHSNRYYSYRRDYTHKRMASVVTTKRRGPDV